MIDYTPTPSSMAPFLKFLTSMDWQETATLWASFCGIWRGPYGAIDSAPLELIAHVVENDLPYSEILTADYTMVNWFTQQVFRSDVEVGSFDDPKIFVPGRNRGSVARDDDYVSEQVPGFGTFSSTADS